MFFRLFNWLVKRTPYTLAFVLVCFSWASLVAFFGFLLVFIGADFEATNTGDEFILLYFLSFGIASLLILKEYGFLRLFGIKCERQEFKILNENILNGHLRPDISNETLLQVYGSLCKITRQKERKNILYGQIIVITVTLGEWLFSGQLTNVPIVFIGLNIATCSLYIYGAVFHDLITASARRECKILLSDRGIHFKEFPFIDLKTKSKFFIILIGLAILAILIVVHSLSLVFIVLSAIILTIIGLLNNFVFLSIYTELIEIEKSSKDLAKGEKAIFFSGSSDKEILSLSQSLNKTANEIYSNRKRLEEEKNKTLAIINNFADGLLILDNKNKISLINPKTEILFNTKNKNIVGKSILEVEVFKDHSLLIRGNKKIFRKKFEVNKDLVLEITVLPIISEKRKLGILVIFHDITREKRIETMKTEFVSLAAHQLRTPLSAIKWGLKLFLEGDLGKMTKKKKKFIQGIYNSNEKLILLVNDLLNITSIEEGKYLSKKSLIDIQDIVQFSINSYEKEIKKKRIKFKFQKPRGKLPKINIDKEKITLAIENLLENAIWYTKPKGKIMVSLKKFKNKIEFSIEDTGTGIPKEQQERVFSKFFRADNIVRMETEGTGLSLFIAKNIIEAHKGRIWFKSEENKGTKFYFTLPY
ncbi:MAG: ATP-binding protein [Minisyncoccales bacterium]